MKYSDNLLGAAGFYPFVWLDRYYPGDVAAIGNGRPMIVRDGKWVNATRAEFDATLIRFKCIKR